MECDDIRDWKEIWLNIIVDAQAKMSLKGMTKDDLAKRMGVSKARVSKLFNEPCNMTLATIANMETALGEDLYKRHICMERDRDD